MQTWFIDTGAAKNKLNSVSINQMDSSSTERVQNDILECERRYIKILRPMIYNIRVQTIFIQGISVSLEAISEQSKSGFSIMKTCLRCVSVSNYRDKFPCFLFNYEIGCPSEFI